MVAGLREGRGKGEGRWRVKGKGEGRGRVMGREKGRLRG